MVPHGLVARVGVRVEKKGVVDSAEQARDSAEGTCPVHVLGPADAEDGLNPGRRIRRRAGTCDCPLAGGGVTLWPKHGRS
jgi:hypothetical protein